MPGARRANRPKAPSTCSQARCRSARSAIGAIGSKSPALTSPALATMIAGAPSSASSSRSSAARSSRPTSSPRQPPDVALAPAEHLDGLHGARVDVAAGEDRRRRKAGQSLLLDIDAEPLGPPVPRRGEGDEVGHRRAGGEHSAESLGKLEELAQPVERHLLEPRGQRRGGPGVGDLVIGRGEPVGGQRRRRAAAHDEVEEARAARASGRGLAASDQLGQGGQRSLAGLGHRIAPGLDRLLVARHQHRRAIDHLEVATRLLRDVPQGGENLIMIIEGIRHARILRHGRGAAPVPPAAWAFTNAATCPTARSASSSWPAKTSQTWTMPS